MSDCRQEARRKSSSVILGCALVLAALVLTGPIEYASAVDGCTQDDEQRIHRTIEYQDEVFEQIQLPDKPEITVIINYRKDSAKPMPVMLNWFGQRDRKITELSKHLSLTESMTITAKLPARQAVMTELIERGCALVSFQNSKPDRRPWPKGRAKWVWPTPDPAGAESFARSAKYAPGDWGTVIDWIETRDDLRDDRIGYMGGSTTAIMGFGLISMESRITCAALIAGSGSMREFVEGWKRNYSWKEKGFDVWPETEELFEKWDPILFVDRIFPTALLIINGSDDKIIPIESVRHYYDAIRPHYAKDPDRLQFVVFEGAGHGWDQKWNTFMVVDWFDRYLIQDEAPKPRPRRVPKTK